MTIIDAPAKAQPNNEAPRPSLPFGIDHLDFTTEAVFIIEVTSVMAQKWLDRDPARSAETNAAAANRIRTDIRNGDFTFTGDPVKFDCEGNLVDGRARLAAIARESSITSKKPVRVAVAVGIDRTVRDNIGTGKTWTLKDMLLDDNVDNAQRIAPALSAIQGWIQSNSTDIVVDSVTNRTSRRFLAEHPEVRDIANEATRLTTDGPIKGGLKMKQVAALIWAFDQIDRNERYAFFNRIVTGANLTENDPIWHLRETFKRQRDAKPELKVSGRIMMAVTIKAWNAFREGRSVNGLTFTPGGSKPEAFPTPK